MSRFDSEARVAKSQNQRLEVEKVHNNIMLIKNETNVKFDKVSWKLSILLSNCETSCNIHQQEKLKARLQEKN